MAKRTEQEILTEINCFIMEMKDLIFEYKTFEAFRENRKAQHSLSMLFIAIGELCNKLANEYKNNYDKNILISAISMRNFLSHGYWDVDYQILWDTAIEDIPVLEAMINQNIE
ncbi:MAG: DUF86 domain-containing protein [Erysipelotrichia bacterium]|nr:DUF86 domain-containing protein [Erysipelotrichia bacterium]NCC54758.1 DUF86 domain-containing protein [Erysipelotrichia bacterium]